jgi:3-oxoacyl-[acyl-carrier protein] reductase
LRYRTGKPAHRNKIGKLRACAVQRALLVFSPTGSRREFNSKRNRFDEKEKGSRAERNKARRRFKTVRDANGSFSRYEYDERGRVITDAARSNPAAMTLDEKVAVVTGGNSGIGEAIAQALAQQGANVVIAARRQKENERVAAAIRARHKRQALALAADVSRESDCERLIAETVKKFGRLDILVNNAGIFEGGRLVETTSEAFDRVLRTNLYGTFWCSRAAFRQMQQNGGGYIINISSIAGKQAWSGNGPYSASKFGVMGLTQALADEGKPHHIKCTAICPALVATPMTGLSGADYIQPEDVAQTVLYLLRMSDAVWQTEIVMPRKGAE